MIVDETGVVLTPGNMGRACLGNGERGEECCCDECDYIMCCLESHDPQSCDMCCDSLCPHAKEKASMA